jgi:hypothetical protein
MHWIEVQSTPVITLLVFAVCYMLTAAIFCLAAILSRRAVAQDLKADSANRAAQVMRAAYRHSAKLNRGLPPALPRSGIVFNSEDPSQKGLPFKDFSKWLAAWERIESPRGAHLCGRCRVRPRTNGN